MFHPIQPIYIARPTFIGMRDPCNETIAWISGNDQTTHITEQEDISFHGRIEEQYTKQQAERMRDRVFRDLPMVDNHRHFALYNSSIWIAKLCWQGHFDLDEMKDELEGITLMWGGNNKKDRATIEDAFRDGYKAMEGSNSDQF